MRMRYLSGKVIAGLLAGTMLTAGAIGFSFAQAAPAAERTTAEAEGMSCPPGHMKLDAAQAAEKLADTFGLDKAEILSALQDKQISFHDAGRAAMLAKASGKPFAEVAAMKTSAVHWPEIEKKLGVSREKVKAVMDELLAARLEKQAGIAPTVTAALLQNGYRPWDIEAAGVLSRLSGKDIQWVLDQKKISNTWNEVAKSLGIEEKALRGAIQPGEGPGMGWMGGPAGGPPPDGFGPEDMGEPPQPPVSEK